MNAAPLAVLGAPPAFAEPVHVGRPNVGDVDAFLSRMRGILERRWLTNQGPLVQEFEQRLEAAVAVPHCVATCNATVALEIVARAIGLEGEVLVPSMTFVATPHSLAWQGITPVFCDIDPRTHMLDPGRVEAMITPRTTGIVGVHLWGNVCDVAALEGIAGRHSLALIFDAAHAFCCRHQGRPIGGNGLAEIFSFHATKFFNTFEGGAVATRDDVLARQIRLMRNFGFQGIDDVVGLGINGKMSEASAAMGLTAFDAVEEFLVVNRRNFAHYRDGLAGLPGVRLLEPDCPAGSNYGYVVLEIDPREAGLTRDELHAVLWAENVLARRYFYPGCHRVEPYRTRDPHAGRELPVTERVVERVLVLPTGTSTSPEAIERIAAIVGTALARRNEVRAAVSAVGIPDA